MHIHLFKKLILFSWMEKAKFAHYYLKDMGREILCIGFVQVDIFE